MGCASAGPPSDARRRAGSPARSVASAGGDGARRHRRCRAVRPEDGESAGDEHEAGGHRRGHHPARARGGAPLQGRRRLGRGRGRQEGRRQEGRRRENDRLDGEPGLQRDEETPVMAGRRHQIVGTERVADQVIGVPRLPGVGVAFPGVARGTAIARGELPVDERGEMLRPIRTVIPGHRHVALRHPPKDNGGPESPAVPRHFTTARRPSFPAGAEAVPRSLPAPGRSANAPCRSDSSSIRRFPRS